MKTNVICPVCGAHFAISENEHVVENALVIGKDSNLGNIYLQLEGDRKDARIDSFKEQLAKRGIDVSKYVSICSPNGDENLMHWNENGDLVKVDENDPVIQAIRKAGNVPNRRLFRRWVMAQMFRGLSYSGWYRKGGFTEWMKSKGYKYTWKQTIEEFRVQAILARNDGENFAMRNRWFNKGIAVAMCKDYIRQLEDYVDGRKIHRCQRVPYKKIGSLNVYVSEIDEKVFNPLNSALARVEASSSPQELYESMGYFFRKFPVRNPNFEQSKAWQDAYKGSGAYFTMRNLIMFHGAKYVNCLSYNESLEQLDAYAWNCEGYEMLGALKEMIRQNDIDIEAKMAEWRK